MAERAAKGKESTQSEVASPQEFMIDDIKM